MNQRVTYILSNIDKAIAFEWIVEKLKNKFDFHFIIIGSKKGFLQEWLQKKNVSVTYIKYNGKKDLPFAWVKTLLELKKHKPAIVHSHLFEANIIGLTSAKVLGVKKRIYTRHHSTFHHDNFPGAVKWDLRTNKWATDIIAISKNVQNVLIEKENAPSHKTHLIHHGFDLKSFNNISVDKVEFLRNKYSIPRNTITVGVISRFIEWKGIQHIIDAFDQFTKIAPNAHIIFANAIGPNEKQTLNAIKEKLQPSQYTLITFENDLFHLYQLFDYYIHTPIDPEIEAFGQTYVEALAAGIPSIFTKSGVAHEFIEHRKNAWVVDYKNSDSIYEGLQTLTEDKILRNKLIENGKQSVNPFSLDLFTEKLAKLYES